MPHSVTSPGLGDLVAQLGAVLGPTAVFHRAEDVLVYEYDFGLDRALPDVVTLPETTAQMQAVVRLVHAAGVPIVARGAGTGVSGGAVPRHGGVVISTARMRRVLDVDIANRCAVVQPGVVNLELSQLVAPAGLVFAPDPASQKVSTIGGNIANNAGGPHCLALGVTTNHVLGLEVVLHDGTLVRLGGKSPDGPGLDLVGLFVGSEGTLGIVTEATVRLLPLPESVRTTLAIFNSLEQAGEAVSRIIGQGIIPSALEIMDQLALRAVEEAFSVGYPPAAGSVLLVEVDGLEEHVSAQATAVDVICREAGAVSIRVAASTSERAGLWAGRKAAISALGRIAPNYYAHDVVVPRRKLPAALAQVTEIAARHKLPIANLFHAGDGNLHPTILFDAREPGIMDRVLPAGREIIEMAVRAGGSISGEHGIGIEKQAYMPLIFSPEDIEAMRRVRAAIDPDTCLNPDKLLPLGNDRQKWSPGRMAKAAPGLAARLGQGMWV